MWAIVNSFRLMLPIIFIILIGLVNLFGIKLINIGIASGWGFGPVMLNLENNIELARMISTLIVLFTIIFIAVRNYSPFIPQKLGVKMYFDTKKTQAYWDKLPTHLQDKYQLASNIDDRLERFWKEVAQTVKAKSKGDAHFTPDDISTIVGDGEVKIEMSASEGFQQYFIKSAEGAMKLSYPKQAVPLDTLFEIVDNDDRHVSVPIANLIRARGFYIHPTFTQLYKQPYGDAEPFKNLVVLSFISAGTRIRITHSIYLLKADDCDKFIPIGFGIYRSI